METEKYLCLSSIVVAGLVVLIFLLDAAVGFPFGRKAIVLDILFTVGGAFVLWQGYETYREFR
jgi:threonine/homoserine/homoserine lactone efflux protein